MLLANLSWPEVKKLKLANRIVVLPLGSFEQHGPHLPLTTDTDIVTCHRAQATRKNSLPADALAGALDASPVFPGHVESEPEALHSTRDRALPLHRELRRGKSFPAQRPRRMDTDKE